MEFDLMMGTAPWKHTAALAQKLEQVGFSGMLFTETSQVPWMKIAAAALAAPSLTFSTGIAVAFPRSPMVMAQIAWELAENTKGRFRLGLGSQVKAHIQRRYGVSYDQPAKRMKDYVQAVKACFRAFRGEEPLQHQGAFYQLNLLPPQWTPQCHDYSPIKVDISAVGPHMTQVAGEVADGIHVHPWHSMPYLHKRLLPNLQAGATKAGRQLAEIDLIVPVFVVPGDTPEERKPLLQRAKTQIAFYGSTPNYSFQFEDLGYAGMTQRLGEHLKSGDRDAMVALITDEMLEDYALIAPWEDLADKLVGRYRGLATRIVTYLGEEEMVQDAKILAKWGEIAQAVRQAK